ncbi:MAG: hypothetical protein QOJ03_58 [Frankiaceae bacterium]|jgi:uncharacterized protein YkwD|nr:hypothetical protein [Frankiaceae bacterium]
MTRSNVSIARTAASLVTIAMLAMAALTAGPLVRQAHAATYASAHLSTFDARLVAHINKARAARGLSRLIATAGTTDVAHGWSCHMASQVVLAHNSKLAGQLETHGSALWRSYAENVGYQGDGASADRLFKAYMNSPEHRANILDRSARFIGVWSKRSSGFRFNTIDFVGASSSAYNNAYGAPRRSC